MGLLFAHLIGINIIVSVCIIVFYFGFTIQFKDILLSTYPGRLAQCLPLKTIVDLQISDKKTAKDVNNRFRTGIFFGFAW